jgi:stage III sporulation protein AA
VLVFSPPGVGKTTLLRAVIAEMTCGRNAIRCAVIDTRGELSCFLPRDTCADVLSGYPKGEGIEIAARCFNPQLIVCDEIGGEFSEAQAIAAAHNCGVPLLATAHASGMEELLKRDPIAFLHGKKIFSHYVGISRGASDGDYLYETFIADEL